MDAIHSRRPRHQPGARLRSRPGRDRPSNPFDDAMSLMQTSIGSNADDPREEILGLNINRDDFTVPSLGLRLFHTSATEMTVYNIYEGGVIQAWNIARPAEQLLVGDVITNVNGYDGSREMAVQLRTSRFLMITVRTRPAEFCEADYQRLTTAPGAGGPQIKSAPHPKPFSARSWTASQPWTVVAGPGQPETKSAPHRWNRPGTAGSSTDAQPGTGTTGPGQPETKSAPHSRDRPGTGRSSTDSQPGTGASGPGQPETRSALHSRGRPGTARSWTASQPGTGARGPGQPETRSAPYSRGRPGTTRSWTASQPGADAPGPGQPETRRAPYSRGRPWTPRGWTASQPWNG